PARKIVEQRRHHPLFRRLALRIRPLPQPFELPFLAPAREQRRATGGEGLLELRRVREEALLARARDGFVRTQLPEVGAREPPCPRRRLLDGPGRILRGARARRLLGERGERAADAAHLVLRLAAEDDAQAVHTGQAIAARHRQLTSAPSCATLS